MEQGLLVLQREGLPVLNTLCSPISDVSIRVVMVCTLVYVLTSQPTAFRMNIRIYIRKDTTNIITPAKTQTIA